MKILHGVFGCDFFIKGKKVIPFSWSLYAFFKYERKMSEFLLYARSSHELCPYMHGVINNTMYCLAWMQLLGKSNFFFKILFNIQCKNNIFIPCVTGNLFQMSSIQSSVRIMFRIGSLISEGKDFGLFPLAKLPKSFGLTCANWHMDPFWIIAVY